MIVFGGKEDDYLETLKHKRPVIGVYGVFTSLRAYFSVKMLRSVVPTFFAKKVSQFMPIKIHNIKGQEASMDLYLYWAASENDDPGLKWFKSVVRDIVLPS